MEQWIYKYISANISLDSHFPQSHWTCLEYNKRFKRISSNFLTWGFHQQDKSNLNTWTCWNSSISSIFFHTFYNLLICNRVRSCGKTYSNLRLWSWRKLSWRIQYQTLLWKMNTNYLNKEVGAGVYSKEKEEQNEQKSWGPVAYSRSNW